MKGAYFAKISPQETYLASAMIFSPKILLWSIDTGAVTKTLDGHIEGTYSVGFSDDETFLASLGRDRSIKVWDIAKEKVVAEKEISPERFQDIPLSSDTSIVVQFEPESGDITLSFKNH